MSDTIRSIERKTLSGKELLELAERFIPSAKLPRKIRIIKDTSDFYRVEHNDILILEGRPYLIGNNKYEGRFGVSDQPKFWVKSAIDLITGNRKIIKLVYHEKFRSRIGDLIFDCVRSPKKEARILNLVRDHPNFMQGFSTKDAAGNIIRIIDHIPGPTIADHVINLGKNHEEYFFCHFPAILDGFIELVKAIRFLHNHAEKHGDIRRDHIIREQESGRYKWIDFDFNYMHRESMFSYDLFGLGNVLVFLVGRGDVTVQELNKNRNFLYRRLEYDDLNIVFKNRVVNLKKIYPYIPASLNFVLLHFSAGAFIFYDNTEQMYNDLMETKEDLG